MIFSLNNPTFHLPLCGYGGLNERKSYRIIVQRKQSAAEVSVRKGKCAKWNLFAHFLKCELTINRQRDYLKDSIKISTIFLTLALISRRWDMCEILSATGNKITTCTSVGALKNAKLDVAVNLDVCWRLCVLRAAARWRRRSHPIAIVIKFMEIYLTRMHVQV